MQHNITLYLQKIHKNIGTTCCAAIFILAGTFGVIGSINSVQANQAASPTRTAVVAQGQPKVNPNTIHHNNVAAQPQEAAPIPVASTKPMQVAPVVDNTSYQGVARQAAIAEGIDPGCFVRQIGQESGFNPQAVSPVGAIGIAQLMPGTAASLGVNPHDPVASLHAAARMMKGLQTQFGGDYRKALAAYNAGPGAVQVAINSGGNNWLANLPAETQNYVQTIA